MLWISLPFLRTPPSRKGSAWVLELCKEGQTVRKVSSTFISSSPCDYKSKIQTFLEKKLQIFYFKKINSKQRRHPIVSTAQKNNVPGVHCSVYIEIWSNFKRLVTTLFRSSFVFKKPNKYFFINLILKNHKCISFNTSIDCFAGQRCNFIGLCTKTLAVEG